VTSPEAGPELDLEFPPKPEYVRAARLAIGALARLHDVPDEVVEDIKLAVSEACNTALPDRDDPAPPNPIQVVASVGSGRLTVEVIDRSSSLQRGVSGRPLDLETGDLPFDRALALPLIRGLVERLTIEPLHPSGASILMEFAEGKPAH
jgi:serine/threonine-protein kinase RsbW